MTDDSNFTPLTYPEDPMESGADYLLLRMDVVYALARGATSDQIAEAFLTCMERDEFMDFLESACAMGARR